MRKGSTVPDKTPTDTRRHGLAFRLSQAEMALDDVTVAARAMEDRLSKADSLLRAIDYERGAEARPPLSEDNLEQMNDYLAKYPDPIQ
jgi:hypothetical protein